MKTTSYDYVVIGGGTAGCVVANRLSEDPNIRVLLIEAGPRDTSVTLKMPAALGVPLGSAKHNWQFVSEPETGLGGRTSEQHRGRVLGGSSSINGMVFVRGNRRDYDGWAEDGLKDWSYAHCLPYFKKMETFEEGGNDYRGDNGPLNVSRCKAGNPLYQAFLAAGQDYGLRLNPDHNAADQDGVNVAQSTTHKGQRWSASRAYLGPIMSRPNLTVTTDSHVTGLRRSHNRVTGVDYVHRGAKIASEVEREVVLCAGAFGTPQMLMLAGIGEADALRRLGIDVVQDLPGVGKNLQDHVAVPIQNRSTKPVSPTRELSRYGRYITGAKWMLSRRGLGASNYFEVGAFFQGDGADYVNYQHEFFPMIGEFYRGKAVIEDGFQYFTSVMRPESRGEIGLKSADPHAPPSIRLNMLTADEDMRQIIEGVKMTRDMVQQKSWDTLRGVEVAPGPDVQTDAEIEAWARQNAGTGYHAVGTCRMGTDRLAVTDSEGRVHGIEGLRIADASLIPSMVTGNTNGPTFMVAEKIADRIKGTVLPPVHAGLANAS